jgi:hypothetical protein
MRFKGPCEILHKLRKGVLGSKKKVLRGRERDSDFGNPRHALSLPATELVTLARADRTFVRNASGAFSMLSLLFAIACNDIAGPALPGTAEIFHPPSFYSVWWDMTRACSGADGRLSDVTWYVVPNDTPLRLSGKAVDGYWESRGNRIVMKSSGIFDGEFIRHEMLHSLSKGGGHSRSIFLDKCGGTVNCESECLADAGPAPVIAASVPRVSPDSLELSVAVSPASPSASSDEGYFSVTVTVKNRAAHPVVAALPPSGDYGPPVSFSYDLEAAWGGVFRDERASDNSITTFAAGESKIHIFDFFAAEQMSNGRNIIGINSVKVAYGSRWLPPIPVTIRP